MQSRGKGRLLQAKAKLAAQATLLASSREQAQASAAERKAERDAAEVAAVLDWPLFVTLCVGFSLCLYPVASLSLLPLPLPLSPSLPPSLSLSPSLSLPLSLFPSLPLPCCLSVPLPPSLSLANCASSGSFVSLILILNFFSTSACSLSVCVCVVLCVCVCVLCCTVCCCAVCVVVLCAGLAIVSYRINNRIVILYIILIIQDGAQDG
eukprot:COSAG06_NODE_139_length_22328_cov_53.042107_7_plen_208_part_00